MTKKELRGLKEINGHAGKKKVYDEYKKTNPDMAEKYLNFVSKNTGVSYINWDSKKNKFS